MFYPQRTKWHGMGNGPQMKMTVQLTANYNPLDATTDEAIAVRFPVLRKPADAARPAFGIAKRKNWRQDNWSLGWGQFRDADKNRFWYGLVHTFRDNEISAPAASTAPATNINSAAVDHFCEYGGAILGSELITNGAFTTDYTGWTPSVANTLSVTAGGQSGNCLTVTNQGTTYGYGYQAITTVVGLQYKVTAYHKNGTTTGDYRVGTTAGGQELVAATTCDDANWTLKTFYFRATTTTTYMRFGNATNTNLQTTLWDTISVKASDSTTVRNLYAAAATSLYVYDFSAETWTAVDTGATGDDLTGSICEITEAGGAMYVSRLNPSHYFTLTSTTWADGASVKTHFAYHDGVIYAAGDPAATPYTGNTVYYGAAWANSFPVGGSDAKINKLISFKGGLYAFKDDGFYACFTAPADATAAAAFQPSAVPVQLFPTQRSTSLGSAAAVWGDRLWFNAGTSLAYFDGLEVVMVEYPWATAPAPLSTIRSLTAMDDVLLVGFDGYILAYYDRGVGTAPTWHFVAYIGSDTRQTRALWFTRIPDPSRVFFGRDDVAGDAQNTYYMKMQNGLFMPSTFATSADWYSSWIDDSDQTITKWLMEAYVEVDNCDANNTVTLSYRTDGSTGSFTTLGAAITADGISKQPASGYVGGSTLVTFRSIQLKATIVSAGSVSPIIKAIELVFHPRPPDRRQFDLTLLCGEEWEVGTYTSRYTSKQYHDFLWKASQQDTPIIFTDEYGDAYTVSMVLADSVEGTEDGDVKSTMQRVHMEEV